MHLDICTQMQVNSFFFGFFFFFGGTFLCRNHKAIFSGWGYLIFHFWEMNYIKLSSLSFLS